MSAWRSTGLWAAAVVLVATTGAARASDGGALAHGTSAVAGPTPAETSSNPGGDVVATIPVAAFGPADGLPQALVVGRTYPVVITVWVAANSGPAVVDVVASSGRLVGTTHTSARAGITRLHYVLVVARGSTQVTIRVKARTRENVTITRTFDQAIG